MNRRAFLSVLMGLPLLGPLLRLTKTAPKVVKVADGTVWFDKPLAKGQEMTFRYGSTKQKPRVVTVGSDRWTLKSEQWLRDGHWFHHTWWSDTQDLGTKHAATFWDEALTSAEIEALANGKHPLKVRPDRILLHLPICSTWPQT